MSYYRTFLNRYNFFDANIPGNDFQFPVSIEGVLGYNNAIQLTQPMHMQDLKYFRDPLWSYGDWVSSGETSKCTAFTDNPGNTANWNNTYEQYIAREAWQAYKVHGGNKAILENFATYAECDIKGQLAKYDTNNNGLIAYDSGALTGNDADAVALAFYSSAPQERTETAFWYSGARAAAEAYALLGRPGQGRRDERDRRPDPDRDPHAAVGRRADRRRRRRAGADRPRAGQVRQRRAPRRRSRSTPRCRPDWSRAINDFTVSTWVNPASDHDLVADLRFRHRHDAKHVLDDQRRRSRHRASRSRPAAAAPSSRSTYNGRCHSTSGATWRSRSSGTTGRLYSTAPSWPPPRT